MMQVSVSEWRISHGVLCWHCGGNTQRQPMRRKLSVHPAGTRILSVNTIFLNADRAIWRNRASSSGIKRVGYVPFSIKYQLLSIGHGSHLEARIPLNR